jgi:DNA primase
MGLVVSPTEHLEALRAERVQSVVLALDNDEPGRKASEKIADQLSKEGFSTSIISPPKKKDWNEEVLGVSQGKVLRVSWLRQALWSQRSPRILRS